MVGDHSSWAAPLKPEVREEHENEVTEPTDVSIKEHSQGAQNPPVPPKPRLCKGYLKNPSKFIILKQK